MPVTKKQGAIFAIYADSPQTEPKSTRSAAGETFTASPTQSTGRKRVPTERKALGALAPAANARSALRDVKVDVLAKGKKSASITDGDLKKPSSSAASVRKPLPLSTTTKKREVSVSARVGESPTKKTRSTPVKKSAVLGDAFHTAIEGSPASRTRSKTSAATPVRADSVRRTGVVDPEPAAEDIDVPSDLEAHFGDLVGDGRGALNARKGKAVAAYLQSKAGGSAASGSPSGRAKSTRISVLFEETASVDTENIPPIKVGRGTPRRSAHSRLGKAAEATPGKGKAKAVLGDKPLADVSEAYGASGIEPIGFRDVETCDCEHEFTTGAAS